MCRYLQWLLDLLGFNPAQIVRSVVVIFACPVRPHVALEARLDDGREPDCQKPSVMFGDIYNNRRPAKVVLAASPYVRGGFTERNGIDIAPAVLLDGDDNPNYYEACFKLTHDGVTRYYPGGVPAPLNSRIAVIKCFARMAWDTGAGGRGPWLTHYDYRSEELITYTVGPDGASAPVRQALAVRDGGTVEHSGGVLERMRAGGPF
jgi:hypothetical protein